MEQRNLEKEPVFHSLLEKIKEDAKIIAAIVYGSYITKTYYRDIDICLICNPVYVPLDIDSILYYKGSFSDIFDINFFERMSLPIQYSVFKEGVVLICKNNEFLFDLHVKTIKDYGLFYPRFKRLLEAKLSYGDSSN